MTQRRHKSFGGGKRVADYDPIDFDLMDENFVCKSAVQGATLLEFVAAADSDNGGKAASALYGFFEDVMEPGEYKRFRDYLKNPDIIFDFEVIGNIAGWLVEEYATRPTEPSKSSAGGPSSSGPMSTERESLPE